MSRDLEYDGRPELNRRRAIQEVPVESPESPAPAPQEADPVEDATTSLFTNLGRTYLKGRKLREGLSLMAPDQFIPIREEADQVVISAIRLDEKASLNGTIVPFGLFQACIDILGEKQWQVRRAYDRPDIPADYESSSKTVHTEYNDSGEDLDNFLSAFLTGSGMAGSILSGLTAQMIQSQGNQSLTSKESGAKAVFAIQQVLGIVALIELGVQAAQIIKMLKKANDPNPDIESMVRKYENKEERRKVLEEAGFDPDKFYKSQALNDALTIIEYCNSWIEAHIPTKPGVYDHWVAYGNVVARQNVIRSALDTATEYSKDFSEMFDRDRPQDTVRGDVVENYGRTNPQSRIHSSVASHFNALETESTMAYDQILNTFMYQVSDDDLCCLVEIFGSMDPGALRTVAQLLRIAAIDMQGVVVRAQDGYLKALVNVAAASIYKIIGKMNKASNDLAVRMLEAFEEIEEELSFESEHCITFHDVKLGMVHGMEGMQRKVDLMLMDMLHYIDHLGTPGSGVWHVPAERRYLLSTAEVLETLSDKLDAASVCDHKDNKNKYEILVGESKDQAANEVIHTLLEKSPPSIQISDNDVRKYFPDLQPSKSPRFGFEYGPKAILGNQVSQRSEALNNCGVEMTEERKSKIQTTISNAMAKAFGRQDG